MQSSQYKQLTCIQQCRGLSLVELMVVVVLVLILVGLSLSALGKIPAKMRAAHCTNNLRQIAVAYQLYEADNDGFLPLTKDLPANKLWTSILEPYLSSKEHTEVMECPQWRFENGAPSSSEYTWGYGMTAAPLIPDGLGNTWNSNRGSNHKIKLASILYPSKRVLVADTDSWFIFPDFNHMDASRHPNGGNVLFFDGHVESGLSESRMHISLTDPASFK
ncbi:MAG: H-X9-DG-CTERM domain-containing protein [Verrucomicrobiota bacterium]